MRYSVRSLLLLTLVVALFLTSILFVRQQYTSMFEGEPAGLVTDRAAWPRGLQELISEAGISDAECESFRVYRFNDWAFDSEYVWSCDALPALTNTLVEGRGLTPIAADGEVADIFVEKIPGDWGIPDLSQDCEVYSTPNFLIEYMEGDMFVVIFDKRQGKLFVWYTFHF